MRFRLGVEPSGDDEVEEAVSVEVGELDASRRQVPEPTAVVRVSVRPAPVDLHVAEVLVRKDEVEVPVPVQVGYVVRKAAPVLQGEDRAALFGVAFRSAPEDRADVLAGEIVREDEVVADRVVADLDR